MNSLTTRWNNVPTGSAVFEIDLFDKWIKYIDATPKTVETYSRAIKRFLVYLTDNDITAPERDDVISYRDMLKLSYKPTTVQSYMAAVKLFFRWTEQERLYPNVAERVKGAKIDTNHKKDYLTTNQVSKVLSAIDRTTIKGLRDYAMLSLMVTTGLRTVSISRANIGDLRTLGDGAVLYHQGKGHDEKADYVKIAEPVEEAIREYLNARGDSSDRSPLFSSISNRNDGERMTTKSISRAVKERLIDAGYNSERLTAHSLRHTAATLNLMNGGTVEETQQMLGHTSINTTMIYAHALERSKNDSERRIAKAIFGK